MKSKHVSAIRVVAIVPLTADAGSDELLILRGPDGLILPAGALRSGERLLDAATRIVLEQAGLRPNAVRLVYLLEASDGSLLAGVLCALPDDIDDGDDVRGEFISVSGSAETIEPVALREILVEDLRSGFVRPVAHLVESVGSADVPVQITW